jgi:hypothetical protein
MGPSITRAVVEIQLWRIKLFIFYLTCEVEDSVFDSVVAGAFQITFRVKIHVNDVFLFFKNHF